MFKYMKKIIPLNNQVHVEFLDKFYDGKFYDQGIKGLSLPRLDLHQVHGRWAKIINIGPNLNNLYKENDYVFVDVFRWTLSTKLNDKHIWRIDPEGILAHISFDDIDDMDDFKFFNMA